MNTTNINFKEIFKRKIKECLDAKKYNTGSEHLKDLIDEYEGDIKHLHSQYVELVRMSKKMRELQVEYFKTRDRDILKRSIQYEQLVDKILYLINDKLY